MPVPTADCVVAGFPCIGFSVVGKHEGFEQPQSRLFYDMLKVIDASRASTVFLENVPGVLRDSRAIVRELSVKRGFELRWCVLGACHAGAPHRRLRWFCLGLRSGSPLRHMTLQITQGGMHTTGNPTTPHHAQSSCTRMHSARPLISAGRC